MRDPSTNQEPAMNDRQNLTIGLLCVTAALLATAVFFLQSTDNAVAAGSESREGDYIMVSNTVTSNNDVVFVIDVGSQKMNAYMVDKDPRRNEIILIAGTTVDLKNVFDTAATMRKPK
jgi:hypothetical protein